MIRLSTSRFRIQPNPPVVGESCEVTYVGPATKVEYQVDGGKSVQVVPDRNGKFKITAIPVGDEIVFSDNLGLPGYLHADIVSSR